MQYEDLIRDWLQRSQLDQIIAVTSELADQLQHNIADVVKLKPLANLVSTLKDIKLCGKEPSDWVQLDQILPKDIADATLKLAVDIPQTVVDVVKLETLATLVRTFKELDLYGNKISDWVQLDQILPEHVVDDTLKLAVNLQQILLDTVKLKPLAHLVRTLKDIDLEHAANGPFDRHEWNYPKMLGDDQVEKETMDPLNYSSLDAFVKDHVPADLPSALVVDYAEQVLTEEAERTLKGLNLCRVSSKLSQPDEMTGMWLAKAVDESLMMRRPIFVANNPDMLSPCDSETLLSEETYARDLEGDLEGVNERVEGARIVLNAKKRAHARKREAEMMNEEQ